MFELNPGEEMMPPMEEELFGTRQQPSDYNTNKTGFTILNQN